MSITKTQIMQGQALRKSKMLSSAEFESTTTDSMLKMFTTWPPCFISFVAERENKKYSYSQ